MGWIIIILTAQTWEDQTAPIIGTLSLLFQQVSETYILFFNRGASNASGIKNQGQISDHPCKNLGE